MEYEKERLIELLHNAIEAVCISTNSDGQAIYLVDPTEQTISLSAEQVEQYSKELLENNITNSLENTFTYAKWKIGK